MSPIAPLAELDARLFHAVYDASASPPWISTMLALSLLGSGWALLGTVPLLRWPQGRHVVRSLLLTVLVTAGLVALLKLTVGRMRPCLSLAGVAARCVPPTDHSFPSGHAAGSFAVATFVAMILQAMPGPPSRLRTGAALGLFVLAAAIALSRVVLGVHFPGDVTAGALLGVALGGYGATLHLRGALGGPAATVLHQRRDDSGRSPETERTPGHLPPP